MQRKLICIVTLVCIFACMAGISASAAALPPSIQPVNKDWISNSDIVNASHRVAYTYRSTNNGVLGTVSNPKWEVDGDTAGAKYTLPWGYKNSKLDAHTTVSRLSRLMNFDLDYIYFFALWVRVRYDVNYSLPIESLSIAPVYTTADGTSTITDTMHAVERTESFTSTIGPSTNRQTDTIFNFNGSEFYVPFNPAWLTDGYYLSGFSYTFKFSEDDQETPPSVTFIYSGYDYYQYSTTSEIAAVIEDQTKELTGAIKDSADKTTDAINKSTDKVLKEDFGYKTPDNPNTDSGLDAGNNLISDLNDKMAGFGDEINSASDTLNEGLDQTASVVSAIVNAFPPVVVALIAAMIVFVVLRKVFGR